MGLISFTFKSSSWLVFYFAKALEMLIDFHQSCLLQSIVSPNEKLDSAGEVQHSTWCRIELGGKSFWAKLTRSFLLALHGCLYGNWPYISILHFSLNSGFELFVWKAIWCWFISKRASKYWPYALHTILGPTFHFHGIPAWPVRSSCPPAEHGNPCRSCQ